MSFIINMLERKTAENHQSRVSYPGVEAEQTDASRVDDVSNRVGAGAIQVLLIFSGLDELSAR